VSEDFPCTDPDFRWVDECGWWSPCASCGRVAWEHEQADPLADLRNQYTMYLNHGHPRDYPPAMRSMPWVT
jgi:hypothetical protein